MELIEIVRRVKRGVRLLDRKIPNWRQVLRKHQDQYDFRDGDHCVLGTLEHFSGRMRVLKAKNKADEKEDYTFGKAYVALGLKSGESEQLGFDWTSQYNNEELEIVALDALWRAEFEKV